MHFAYVADRWERRHDGAVGDRGRPALAARGEQPAVGRDSLQDEPGVSTLAEGAVNEDVPRLGLEELYGFF